MTQEHCKISHEDDGTVQAISSTISLTVLPDGEVKAFNRNGLQKNISTGETKHLRFVVGELDGVRVYLRQMADGVAVVLTKQDLYP